MVLRRYDSICPSDSISSQRLAFPKPTVFLALAVLLAISCSLRAQSSPSSGVETPAADAVLQGNIERWTVLGQGVPDDWSHHHLVFSNPGTEKQAVENGTFERWLKVSNNSRFTLQQVRRSRGVKALELMDTNPTAEIVERFGFFPPKPGRFRMAGLKKDWNVAIGGIAASATGTVSANNANGTTTVSTVGVNGQTLSASAPVAATATGTFTGAPTNGQTITINALKLTLSSTASLPGSGTITVANGIGAANGDTLTVGSVTYTFEQSTSGSTYCSSANPCNGTKTPTNSNCQGTGPCVWWGTTAENTAQAIYAAITNNPAACPTVDVQGGVSIWQSTCYSYITSPNSSVVATVSNAEVFLTNTSGTQAPFADTSNQAAFTLVSTSGSTNIPAGTNSCTSANAGSVKTSSTAATGAWYLAAAINSCENSYPSVGVTATSNGAVVTLTANTPGSAGNSIGLAESASKFTWSGTSLSGGNDGTTSATTFAYYLLTPAQVATNLATAINANTSLQSAVTATSSGNVVTVRALTPGAAGNSIGTSVGNFSGFTWLGANLAGGLGATVQPNVYPAKYSFSTTTASCSDFVVYPTGTAGAASGASIVAYSNLYVGGCKTGTVPSAYWAYNTGGMVTTSPILSLDGSQIAFIQTNGGTPSLVLLKWAAGTGTPTAPATPSTQTASTYRSCTAPCMLTLPLSGSLSDTFSSPFYDYDDDIVYVGDDNGNLHKFTGVLGGTPAEVTASWPVSLGSASLSSPVYDGHQYVIVGDFGGVLHSVIATTGVVSGTTVSFGDVIADAPLVDGNVGMVYAFVTTGATGYQPGKNAVVKLPTNFTAATVPSTVAVGTGGARYYLYAGTFDNVYYSSTTSTGNLYVVGNTGTAGGGTLYRIPITTSALGTPVTAATGLNSTLYPFPSPVSEFCNNGASACVASTTATTTGADYIFFSVNRGAVSGCTNATGHGCVLSYNVSDPANVGISNSGLDVTTPGTNGCWATGGIVVDGSVPTATMAGASQTYFLGMSTNAAGGPTSATSGNCTAGVATTISATQASQSNP